MNRTLWLFLFLLLASFNLAEAQQPKKVPRIGFPSCDLPFRCPARVEAFRQGLRELGYVEGKNIFIEWRFAEGKLDRLPELAAELVRLKVDVIVTGGPTSNPCCQGSNLTIPIVMALMTIPLDLGSSPVLRDPAETLLDCLPLPRR